MKTKKKREIEEEEEESEEGEGVIVGQIPTITIPRHIKKRSLKNKALTVSFKEKDLRDFVTGFHKRKKKRRKEAERHLKEKERLRRIEARKRRKEEKEFALYGGTLEHPPTPDLEPDEPGSEGADDELKTNAPVSETKTYESGGTKITVITRELSRVDEDTRPVHFIPEKSSNSKKKNHSLSVKQKPLKSIARRQTPQKKARKPVSGKKDKRKIKFK